MPAAVSPSIVDARVDLGAIAGVLSGLIDATDGRTGTTAASADPGDGDAYAALLERIRSRSGIDYAAYKAATINRRVRGRMSATGSATVADYAALVESDPVEYDQLVDSLLIKVTEFFRDARLWDHLRSTILPGLVADARREGRELRIWSAGCSTGEEAYSVAIAAPACRDPARDRRGPPGPRRWARRPDPWVV